ncbi:MAG: hypothetical protein MH132_11165 [Hydrotalea sp.]|nr:hypothetical protein [Hydrotalea sp.]
MNKPFLLLSFDVEEFDMPLEYGQKISFDEQIDIGKKGLDVLTPLLNKPTYRSTLFTTAQYAMHDAERIHQLAQYHEIASHTFFHSSFKEEDLLHSRLKLEEISGQKVTGLRMPRMRDVSIHAVKKAGYLYDSSVNPIWLPGRYNKLHVSRKLFKEADLYRLPAGTSRFIRIPFFWLAFKNMPVSLFRSLLLDTLRNDGYCCLYFHPWEFVSLEKYNMPFYTRRPDGQELLDKLMQLIYSIEEDVSFISIAEFIFNKSKG